MHLLAVLLAAALPLDASGWAQILPAGKFSARDGRPGPGKHWTLTDADGVQLAASLSAIAAQTPISIDYEHQTILAPTNGQPAPAAGWMLRFEWRTGAGLWAEVSWTERAKAHILANEYRYISPVILTDKAGNVQGLHNAALVSTPALLGMDAVTAALSAQAASGNASSPRTTTNALEPAVDLSLLITLLGLAAGATSADVTAAITALMSRPAVPTALAAALGLPATADEPTALAALNSRLTTPDASTLQTMQALQAQVAALSAQQLDRQVTELVDGAITAGKLVPAQRDWALGLGKSNLAALSTFVASAPTIPGLQGQLGGRQDLAPEGTALNANQTMLAERLGLDPKTYLAQLNAQRAAA
jgi:phage I-like protein